MSSANLPKHRSFWLQEAMKSFVPEQSLSGDFRADVAILGGGYVGLWTALKIKEKDPHCRVAIVEMDICGGGASGRNGGFVLSWWPKISSLVKLCGETDGMAMGRDSENAIREIERFCNDHQIDAHFRMSPWLWTATSAAQMNSWEPVVQLCEKLGIDSFKRISPLEVARRSGSAIHRAGVIEHKAATVQPAFLAHGLRRVALLKGVQIFENTKVLSFTRTRPVHVKTANGRLICEKLVIATNAWAAALPELKRAIVPITSDMIVTEPAREAIEKTGWTGGECITDSQMMVDYYHVTKDSRIAFGKGGWGIAYGGHLGADFDRNPNRAKTVEADFRRTYPSLKSVRISHDWCGPIDRTPNSLPLLGTFKSNEQIIYGVGWSGNGVGPSVIGGEILSSLALQRKDRWASYPLVGRSAGTFPPEPLRYIGAHLVRAAVVRKEQAEIEDRAPSWIASRISSLAPAGLEDKD